MKKFLFLSMVLWMAFSVEAQSVLLGKTSNAWLTRPNIQGTPIGQDASDYYFWNSTQVVGLGKPKNIVDHIYAIDKGTLKLQDMQVSASGLHSFLGALLTDDQIVTLYESMNKKGDVVTFSVNVFDKKTASVSVTNVNSVSTTANAHYWPSFMTAKSPDGKMLAALLTVTGKNSVLENLYAVVVNDQGEFVWNGPVTPDFKGASFSLGNMTVDNEGNVFIPAYTCNIKGKKVSDVRFLMIKTTGNGSETFEADATFGKPQNFTSKVLSNGDLVIAGFFTDTYQDIMTQSNGYFFYRFDPRSDNFTDARSFDFSSNYAQRNAPARLARVLANQQYVIEVGDIYELKNGSIALCGEHQFIKAIRDMQMNSTTYQLLTKNILVATLLNDGNSAFSMIEKQQIAGGSSIPEDWRSHNISYTAFPQGDDLYFLFNDDPKNVPYPGNGAVCSMGGLTLNKSAKCVLMKLTPDQEITQKVLPNGDQVMRSVEFVDDNSIIVSSIGKSGLSLNKFDLEE